MPVAIKLARETDMFLAWWARKLAPATTAQTQARLAKEIGKLFDKAGKAIIGKLRGMDRLPTGMETRSITDTLYRMKEEYGQIVSDAVSDTYEAAVRSEFLHLGMTPEVVPDRMLEVLETKRFEFCENTMNRITGDVRGSLEQSYKDGLGIDDAARKLEEHFDGLKHWEAERIARTEINSSQSQGAHAVLEEVADYTQWLTAEDERVRGSDPKDMADHVILHGQIVRVDEPYENGLMYPQDPSGEPEEIINCRCRERAYYIPEGFQVPTGMPYFYEEDLIEVPEPPSEEAMTVEVV